MSTTTRLTALLSLVLATSAFALPATYNETISGDLSTFDTETLVLGAGTNKVIGSSAYTSSFTDFDGFMLNLGAGLTINSIEYYISNLSVSNNTTILYSGFSLKSGTHSGSTLATTTIDLLGNSSQMMFGSTLPLSGAVALSTTPNVLGRSGDGGTWDYEIRINVTSAVPSGGSTAAMLGGALMGLVALFRQRQRR